MNQCDIIYIENSSFVVFVSTVFSPIGYIHEPVAEFHSNGTAFTNSQIQLGGGISRSEA
jgi:hypothetical protein